MAGRSKMYLRYWWVCAKEAAQGTLERANAWAWLWGLIIALLLCWWGDYDLMLPATGLQLLFFGLALIGLAWVAAFSLRLLGAPARLHGTLSKKKDELEEALKPKLELLANQNCLWLGKSLSISVAVRNISNTTIDDVVVHLDRFVEGQSLANLPRGLCTREGRASRFNLLPHQTEYVLIGHVTPEGKLEYEFADGHKEISIAGRYKIKIKAYADGIPPVNRFFPIEFGQGGNNVSIANIVGGIDPEANG